MNHRPSCRFSEEQSDAHQQEQFRRDILAGLSSSPKRLPCKYFYDERGSQLFEVICELEEYYLTRCESEIMTKYASEVGAQIGPGVMLVEYGSGSSTKTRILLDHLEDPVAYVPVDISTDHLVKTARALAAEYPNLEILPVYADFTKPFSLPQASRKPTHAAVYFPGSTIGNFEPHDARTLLRQISQLCGTGGGLVIGIDLKKSIPIIEAAYNDAQGVTDAFNLNLLHRVNHEAQTEIPIDRFGHFAEYNPEKGRVEIFIVSRETQTLTILGQPIHFAAGERILTEYSHKYSIEEFADLAADAELTLRKSWTDARGYFAVLHFARLP
jgi:dimethylhistidine N-methyltransferase